MWATDNATSVVHYIVRVHFACVVASLKVAMSSHDDKCVPLMGFNSILHFNPRELPTGVTDVVHTHLT